MASRLLRAGVLAWWWAAPRARRVSAPRSPGGEQPGALLEESAAGLSAASFPTARALAPLLATASSPMREQHLPEADRGVVPQDASLYRGGGKLHAQPSALGWGMADGDDEEDYDEEDSDSYGDTEDEDYDEEDSDSYGDTEDEEYSPRLSRSRPVEQGVLRGLSRRRGSGGTSFGTTAPSTKTHPPLPADGDPFLAEVAAGGLLAGQWSRHKIVLPVDWLRKLMPETIMVLGGDSGDSFYMARARLNQGSRLEVQFRARKAMAPENIRDAFISELLSPTGHVPTFIESQELHGVSYVLTESPGAFNVALLLEEREVGGGPTASGAPFVPLETSLPLMLSMLQGAKAMESAGVVHGDLTEDELFIQGKDGRVLITDFRTSCVVGSVAQHISCLDAKPLAGSAYRNAPEMDGDHASHVASNVWQLGLVFARLMLGANPVNEVVEQTAGAMPLRDMHPSDRHRIRDIIRHHFDIKDNPGFKRLLAEYRDVMLILAGMLEKDPARRLTAEAALDAARAVAWSRGIREPTTREPAALPEGMFDEWQ